MGMWEASNTKHKWLDYAVGLLMSPLIFVSIPFNSHKREHLCLTHHALTNSDEDNFSTYSMLLCLGSLIKDFYRAIQRVNKTL